jgi:hypothetical protein
MDSGLLNPEVLKMLGVPTAGALILAALLLWRFERIVCQHRKDGAAARVDFLEAMKRESDSSRNFMQNHLSPMTESLHDLCGDMKGLAAIISECALHQRANGGH